MKISIATGKGEAQRSDGSVLFLYEDGDRSAAAERIDAALGGLVSRLVKQGDFAAKQGAVQIVYSEGRLATERLVLAGLGKRADFTLHRLRHAAGKSSVLLRTAGARTIAFITDGIDGGHEDVARALTEGSMLGLYRFLRYKTNDEQDRNKDIRAITIVSEKAGAAASMRKGARTGETVAGATIMARDMVNHPAADMTPTLIAAQARSVGRQHGIRVRVLGRAELRRLGMGGLLGVSSGSVQPPKFIIAEYRRGGKKPFIALVGKTITFDSGGISIKPAENMDRMKDDMAGGAAVLGAIRAAASLRLPLNIVALLPASENMPGGNAYRPGDVLRTMSGQTIEIINTDAEGRLILSDALTYACRYKPAVIIDVATLTGACTIALGAEAAAMLGNNDTVKQALRTAGDKTGERVWELPLWEEYYDQIKSDVADMKNTGGRAASVITAAALLSRFVQNHPWVHLDIASTAWTDKERPFTPKGGTGVGVRLLTQFLIDYHKAA